MSAEVASDYQQRTAFQSSIIQEKKDIDVRIDALRSFMHTGSYANLDVYQRKLIIEQCDVMREYSGVLARRIDIFRRGVC